MLARACSRTSSRWKSLPPPISKPGLSVDVFQFCVRRLGMSEDEACRRASTHRPAGAPLPGRAPANREGRSHSFPRLPFSTRRAHRGELRRARRSGRGQDEDRGAGAPRQTVPRARRARGDNGHPDTTAHPHARRRGRASSRGGRSTAARAALGDTPQGAIHGERRAAEEASKARAVISLRRTRTPKATSPIVVERAVDLTPRGAAPSNSARTDPRAARSFERDGERFAHSPMPRRASLPGDHLARARSHHSPSTRWHERGREPARALPRPQPPALCRAQTFGKDHVERKIRERRDPRQRGYALGEAATSRRTA